jgi:hypothetical protein
VGRVKYLAAPQGAAAHSLGTTAIEAVYVSSVKGIIFAHLLFISRSSDVVSVVLQSHYSQS